MATPSKYVDSFTDKTLSPALAEQFSKLSAKLAEDFGKTARISPSMHPADPAAKTPTGQELRTNYKGYVVAVTQDFVAQRVDTGQSRTSIVVHERSRLDVPANTRTNEFPPLKEKLAAGRVEKFDLSIGYGADGQAKVYDRDRRMDEIQFAANTLKKHSGLEGAKLSTFEKNMDGAVSNFREAHYDKLREQAQAYQTRQAHRSQADNLVQGREQG